MLPEKQPDGGGSFNAARNCSCLATRRAFLPALSFATCAACFAFGCCLPDLKEAPRGLFGPPRLGPCTIHGRAREDRRRGGREGARNGEERTPTFDRA